MGKIAPAAALSAAEKEMKAWYTSSKKKIAKGEAKTKNCGDNDNFIYTKETAALKSTWLGKGTYGDNKELVRRASDSSTGQSSKVNLKMAHKDGGPALFNYHVVYQKDTSAEDAAAEMSAKDKAAAKKWQEQHEKDLAEAAAAAATAAAALKVAQERDKKLQNLANGAWNKFKKTKAWNKKIDEATWKTKWKADNAGKVK